MTAVQAKKSDIHRSFRALGIVLIDSMVSIIGSHILVGILEAMTMHGQSSIVRKGLLMKDTGFNSRLSLTDFFGLTSELMIRLLFGTMLVALVLLAISGVDGTVLLDLISPFDDKLSFDVAILITSSKSAVSITWGSLTMRSDTDDVNMNVTRRMANRVCSWPPKYHPSLVWLQSIAVTQYPRHPPILSINVNTEKLLLCWSSFSQGSESNDSIGV